MSELLCVLAALLYLAALVPFAQRFRRELKQPGSATRALRDVTGLDLAWVFVCAGVHAVALLAVVLVPGGGLRFGFAPALSAMLLLAVIFFALESVRAPIGLIRGALYPTAAVGVLLPIVFPGPVSMASGGAGFAAHLILALASYGLLSLAALHALAMAFVDYALHRRYGDFPQRPPAWLSTLLDLAPPLLAMERLLFRAITIGFALLTLTLVSGIGFHEQLFGRPLRLDHKTVFSILSWATFGVLLFGRWRYGWRGRLALRYVFFGFMALVLAYIGTHFVFEVMLGRR